MSGRGAEVAYPEIGASLGATMAARANGAPRAVLCLPRPRERPRLGVGAACSRGAPLRLTLSVDTPLGTEPCSGGKKGKTVLKMTTRNQTGQTRTQSDTIAERLGLNENGLAPLCATTSQQLC